MIDRLELNGLNEKSCW